MRLIQDAAQRANGHFLFVRHDRRVDDIASPTHELDVAAFLGRFDKPALSRRRLISRKGSGLSRAKLDLDRAHSGRPGGLRRFKVKFECFLQIRQRLFFGLALAGNIHLKTLGNVPRAFAPDRSGKGSLHEPIVPWRRRSSLFSSSGFIGAG